MRVLWSPRLRIATPLEAGEPVVSVIEEAEELGEAILKILGFFSRHRLDWYAQAIRVGKPEYHSHNLPQYARTRYRVWTTMQHTSPDERRAMLRVETVKTQLTTMLDRLGALKPDEQSLVDAALSSYFVAVATKDQWIRFMMLMTALESLKALYLRGDGVSLKENCSNADLVTLKEILKCTIKKTGIVNDKLRRDRMYAKLGELQRPPFRAALKAMLKAWNVESCDLRIKDFKFIKVRDTMVHQGTIPEEFDWIEFRRVTDDLEQLIERVFCKGVLGLGDLPGLPG